MTQAYDLHANLYDRMYAEMRISMSKKNIVIPIGDIAGVGPEIVVKALNHPEVYDWCNPVVVGERSALERALRVTGLELKLKEIQTAREHTYEYGVISHIDCKNICADEIVFGQVQAKAGKAAFEFIEKAVSLLKEGQADAIATTTINKEALKAAEIPFIGHTEIIGSLLGTPDPMTMFQVRNLKVFFLTRHMSLKDAVAAVTEENVYKYIKRCFLGMQNLGFKHPRIAVAGLNPHAGEHGLFGWEEVKEIVPAIEKARAEGIDISGPIGADSVFHIALQGTFDCVISLYHDQGHIATKMVDFERTISVTIGMPFVRTSVDHGTAFDIAGKNVVSELSMYEAIRLAAEYADSYVGEVC